MASRNLFEGIFTVRCMPFLPLSGELELSRAMVTCSPRLDAVRRGRLDPVGAGGLR